MQASRRLVATALLLLLARVGFAQALPVKFDPKHLFVLDDAGKLLLSQSTGELEAGKDYDKAKLLAFLRRHARS